MLEESSLAGPDRWALLNWMRPEIGAGPLLRLAGFAIRQLRGLSDDPAFCRIRIVPDCLPVHRGFDYPLAGVAEGR